MYEMASPLSFHVAEVGNSFLVMAFLSVMLHTGKLSHRNVS